MLRKIFIGLILIIATLAAVVIFGPREPVDTSAANRSFDFGGNVEAYLAASESAVPNIMEGAQKQIVWANPTKTKTPLSVIYVHGFSATLEEIRPVPDIIARELGANLFFTRLTGHGRDGEAMAEATVGDYFTDMAEAIAVGREIGEEVLVVTVSTGGTFAAWAATQPSLVQGVKGIAFISPNFAINNPAAPLLTMGAARYILPPLVGETRSFEPINEQHGKWWTTSYPSVALLPMAQSVDYVDSLDYSKVTTPALFVWHPEDRVIVPAKVQEIADRWGGPKETVVWNETEDPFNHVLAGRILSPSQTEPMAQRVIEWARGL